jgi:hypothetical protein
LHFVQYNASDRAGGRSCGNADEQGGTYDCGGVETGNGTDRSTAQCPFFRCVQTRAATGAANQNHNR